jgi:N-acetylglucosaminyl-diphospho-decaprenol L-rhamnosyltransferase
MSTRPRLLTVILNWRTPEMTVQAAAAARTAMRRLNGEILIVDNDSQDGSFEAISAHLAAAQWANVRVIQSGRNGGFGAGNNVGIRAGMADGGRPDLVYVLNSDAFPAPDAIEVLEMYLRAHPNAAFAGSLIHGPAGDVHLTTFRFPSIASEFEGAVRFGPVSRLLKSRAVPLPTPDRSTRVDWLAGASLMMRMDVLDKIGLFDETFFLYFEETDLCHRAAKAGFEVHFVPQSRVAHIGSASTGMKEWRRVPAYWFASRWHYFRKNHGALYAAGATLAHVAGGVLHRLRARLNGKPPADPPQFLRDLIAHDLGLPRRDGPVVAKPVEGAS